VASIVGRLFRAQWLTGYYPELGSFPQVRAALDELDELEITPLESEPELIYLFKHIVTHEVTYESLPFATRAKLHEQLARYLESADAPVETIAFHYGRSENKAKQMEYLRRAGEASQKSYANDAALEYYGLLLPLLIDEKEKVQIHLKRGEVLEFIGKYDDAESDYRTALESAKDYMALKAKTQFALGKLSRLRGDYKSAFDWLTQAKETFTKSEDTAGLARTLIEVGSVYWAKEEYASARVPLSTGLTLLRDIGDKFNVAYALNNLGNVISCLGDFHMAQAMYNESLNLRREIDDKTGIASSLNNLGQIAARHGDYAKAIKLQEESLILFRETGDKPAIAMSLNNLGTLAFIQDDYSSAQTFYEDGLLLSREVDVKWRIADVTLRLGSLALAQGKSTEARAFFEESLALSKAIDLKELIGYVLLGLGLVNLADDKPEARENIFQSLRLLQQIDDQLGVTSSLIGISGLVLREGNSLLAAQLLGAVESALKELDATVEIDVKFFYKDTLAKVKEALGDGAFQSAWEEGAKWSLEEAVKKVLG